MAAKQIERHLTIALKEIGKIKPWFDKEIGEWVFSSSLYPVEYSGASPEEVIQNYPLYLREFLAHRLDSRLDELVEKKTKGRGGKRGSRPDAGHRGPGTGPRGGVRNRDLGVSQSVARQRNQDLRVGRPQARGFRGRADRGGAVGGAGD